MAEVAAAPDRTSTPPAPFRLEPVRDGGTLRRPVIFAFVGHGMERARYRERWRQGLEPDESAYGFHHAEALGGDVRYSTDYPGAARWRHRVSGLLIRLLRFDLFHALHNRAAMAQADAIWTMTETQALAVCLLMRLGLLRRRPLIAATVWVVDRWETFGPVRRRFYRWLLRESAVLTVHAAPCLPKLRAILPESRSELLPFGVSARTFLRAGGPVPDAEPVHIVAAGNDLTRDWTTLVEAFGGDARFRLTLVCRRLGPADRRGFDNVRIVDDATSAELLALYRTASYVAVPMVENLFSGITVALEAAALGRPILSSRTGGVPTYFDESEALYAAVGDAGDLRRRVAAQSHADRVAMAQRAQARFLRADYSTAGVIARYAALTNALLADRPAAAA